MDRDELPMQVELNTGDDRTRHINAQKNWQDIETIITDTAKNIGCFIVKSI